MLLQLFLFQSDMKEIIETLENWCNGCDGMLNCLEDQANRANHAKAAGMEHKQAIENSVRLANQTP